MKKKLILGIFLCICCFCVACGYSNDITEKTDITIKWLLPANVDNIRESEEVLVEQELKKAFEDLGIEIDLCFLEEDTYTSQASKLLQTDQEWDMMFLNQELNQVMRNETKKFFAPITEFLNDENNMLYETMPEYAWNIMRVNKEIYAIPNKHCWAVEEGYFVRTDYLEKYGKSLKAGSLTEFDEIEQFFKEVTYKEACIGTYIPQDRWSQELLSHHFYFSGNQETLGVVKETEAGLVVENMFETTEFEEYCHRMRRWYLEDYIRNDSSVRDTNEAVIAQDKKNGVYALEPVEYILPGMERLVEAEYGENYSFEALPTSETFISPNKVAEYSTAFHVNSEHLAEAMAVAERVYQDERIYNLILYGVEGIHYEKLNEKQIKKMEDSGYGPDYGPAVASWALGNQYLSYVMEEEAADHWECIENWEKEAKIPETMGFFFRTTAVSDEIRNVSAILDSELRLLETGSVDVDTFLPELQKKLKEAGADRIIIEYQIQFTRWLENKNEH